MRRIAFVLIAVATSSSPVAVAQVSPLDSTLGESYYYVDHYEVLIDRPASAVWPFVVDFGSWMPGILDANETRPIAKEGEIFRLYGEFFMEVSKVIPERLLVMVNLPATQEREDTHGLMMLSVKEADGRTVVSMFMSRIFYWFETEENALRERRESTELSMSRTSPWYQPK